MPVDYDPYSDEAMSDPTELYRRLREEGAPHYIEKYDTWALTRFDDVWKASLAHEKALDYTRGQVPGQVMLGDPVPRTFMTLNAPEHRKWRGVLTREYTAAAVAAEKPRLRELTRDVLQPLLAQGVMDVYRDFANRIMCRNAGYNLGLPPDDSEMVRTLIDDFLHREKGQVGSSSQRNQAGAQKLYGYLMQFVAGLRAHPETARRHAKLLIEAEIDGRRLSDEELIGNLYSLLVTGSETTPMVTAGVVYYLGKHPEQKAQVLADRSLIKNAFLETCRFDQPTNMLARRTRAPFTLHGRDIKAGQGLLFIYASANRDAGHFERPDVFDIHRRAQRDLSFGIGGHVCLGVNLAIVAGTVMLEELFDAIGDYELLEAECERAYGEFLSGFVKVPVRWERGQ
jgi:cytochrome P450